MLRQQADQSAEPGEQSLNPQGLWRRSQESWHHGAGQDFLDGKSEEAADPHRFRSSKGIDPWTKGQISLLHPTIKAWASTNSNLFLAVTQDSSGLFFILNVADGNEVYGAAAPFMVSSLGLQQGTGWAATNGTIAAFDEWFRVTSTSAAAPVVTSPTGTAGIPVMAGRIYAVAFMSNNISGGGGARIPRVSINWYTSAGVFISTSGPFTAPGSDAAQATAQGSAAAPGTAAYAALVLTWTAAWNSGDVHQVRAASFGPSDLVISPAYPDTWTGVDIQAGEAAQPVQSIATDGTHLWAALGTSGIHRSVSFTSTANVPAAPASGQISLVAYANGFHLAAGSAGVSATRRNTLWRYDDPLGVGALTLIKTHPNTAFAWEGVASGRSVVYAWGNGGGNGEIYKIPFDPSTGTLSTAASSASMLPEGETIHSLYFYAGGIILGTGRGVRLGQADGAGNIDYGPLIETEWPVRCLEPQGRFCWFGWTKYDGTNSGLGRVDLGFFTDTLTPAWASDLMTDDASSGDVVGCATFAAYGYTQNQRPPVRVFTVAGEGVYIEDPGAYVLAGSLDTGTIRFSTSEPKTARAFDIRHHALPASQAVAVLLERESSGVTENPLVNSTVTGSYGLTSTLGDLEFEAIEFTLNLGRTATTAFAASPEVTRWTVKALPTPSTIDETFTIPLIMRREVADNNDANYPLDVDAEIAWLKGLERDRTLVNLQLGSEQHTVFVLASQFEGQNWAPDKSHLEGTYTVMCQTVRG